MNNRLNFRVADSNQAKKEIIVNGKANNILFNGTLSVTSTIALCLWVYSCTKAIRKTFNVVMGIKM